jgi:hypothetical protein
MVPFPLGQVVATPGALKLLEENGEEPLYYLIRHRSGDWGEIDPQDRRENERSLEHGWRLLSSYPMGAERIWIITEADRSVTTILLPEEY